MWKANGRKRGQRDSVLHAITCHSTTRPRLFGSHFGVSQKIPCHLATVNGVASFFFRGRHNVRNNFGSIFNYIF